MRNADTSHQPGWKCTAAEAGKRAAVRLFVWVYEEIWLEWGGGGAAHQGLPVLLFSDEEAGSYTRDKQRAECRAPVLHIFPPSRRVTSRLVSPTLVSDGASRSRIVRRVTQRPSIPTRPRPIGAGGGLSDTDCGDPSCRELSAATCLF